MFTFISNLPITTAMMFQVNSSKHALWFNGGLLLQLVKTKMLMAMMTICFWKVDVNLTYYISESLRILLRKPFIWSFLEMLLTIFLNLPIITTIVVTVFCFKCSKHRCWWWRWFLFAMIHRKICQPKDQWFRYSLSQTQTRYKEGLI